MQTTMLQAIERYMKQAIVDKVPSVSSSALVSSLVNTHLGLVESCVAIFTSRYVVVIFCGKPSVCSAHGEDEL